MSEYKFQNEEGVLTAYNDANWPSKVVEWSCTGATTPRAGAKRNRSWREVRLSQGNDMRICDPRPGAIVEHGA